MNQRSNQDKGTAKTGMDISFGKCKLFVFGLVITVAQCLFSNYFLQTRDLWSSFQSFPLRTQVQFLLSAPPKPVHTFVAHSLFSLTLLSPLQISH